MSAAQKQSVRCAIYTRKSSEEGLEQSFNSLDAQREACQAYILSQRQEGWKALDTQYDDGGYSGGSMERPGLKQLLADIDAKKIDTVVVYKVDRLTRSLADFAKIIEAFDTCGISFVSVTQQFNTTSSMGRLTLNVLLSFAQFEREVTGERIRDKIAASKRKGMWMGGRVPLGYDLKDRRLIINKGEAEQIREIFKSYLELGCVRKLKAHLDKKKARTKIRIGPSGQKTGGGAYSRGGLYKILGNRIYRGEVFHKGNSYTGEHEAIIDRDLWERVQAKLIENTRARRHGTNADAPSLLRGLVYDEEGNCFTPSHAVKNGKRYRYYVSQRVIRDASATSRPGRIPARDLEQLVLNELRNFFSSADRVVGRLGLASDDLTTTQALIETALQFAKSMQADLPSAASEKLTAVLTSIVVHQDSLEVWLFQEGTRALFLKPDQSPIAPAKKHHGTNEEPVILTIPAKLKRCGIETRLIIPGSADVQSRKPVTALVKAVSRAHDWICKIEAGEFKNLRAISRATGLAPRHVRSILLCAFVAPEIVEAILDGSQPPELNLAVLLKDNPQNWTEQRRRKMFAPNV